MSTNNDFETGDLQTALRHAVTLLNRDPALAQEQVSEILKTYPDTSKENEYSPAPIACKKNRKRGWTF